MYNILITGCAGFIASHLAEKLLKNKKYNIIGIDNLYSGTMDNIDLLKKISKKRFKFINTDIRKYNEVDNIVKSNNVEYIFHLAAVVSVQESIKNPIFTNSVNVIGTLNILEAARLNGVRRIVFSSSAAVYGDEPSLPKNENSKLQPISPYGNEKLISEQYMQLYNNLYGLETVSLRYFNVYGERQLASSDYSGVISVFDNAIKNSEIVTIYGNGKQYRDFVYVKDVVQANIRAMITPEAGGEVFCVGTSEKTSINELFKIINKKYKKNVEAVYNQQRLGDINKSICDNKKIKRV